MKQLHVFRFAARPMRGSDGRYDGKTWIGEQIFWSIASGSSPVIGTAIHDVDGTFEEVSGLMALSDM
ncbi:MULTISPECIES: hypothetical protein [unclassified Rhizobium]|uniref:hypothetical protein n=1 Tax=unclassified Rhizobium TaxID=2613769 RepID=UPI001781CE2D|nr:MULTISPECIES: hypothetical protein [unclassified Rhizobium]MBD8687268.1 hypothetical protein [Rhizobium sp. CFBP 13644]MBD8691722.1 hypothetical protein [Rhizobium sp. CFBP 13717]